MMIMLGFGCQIFRKRTRVTDNIAMSREKWNAQQHRLAGNKVIVMGDVVYHSIQEVATKLHPRFEVPYRVISIEHANKITIRHMGTLLCSDNALRSQPKGDGFESLLCGVEALG